MRPVYKNEITAERLQLIRAQPGRAIQGRKVVASAWHKEPGKAAVNWFHLEDGTEVVLDADDNPAEWPEV